MQGGDANQIQDADSALAWISSQLPFVSRNNPSAIVSFTWPTNMEAQDLFPLKSFIDVYVPNGNQSESSLFCSSKQSGGHRTNGMPGFVRQPE